MFVHWYGKYAYVKEDAHSDHSVALLSFTEYFKDVQLMVLVLRATKSHQPHLL